MNPSTSILAKRERSFATIANLMLSNQLLADVAKVVYECTRYNVKESKNG